ncbi:GAF domain-containing protein [Flavihumibacter rivuli]|uniref:GAF domain-containing protein n=1 Tax=Flavihumibacter rivuli TaxID=2838156 RepID=UPI001BDE3105|nr:GAF domain-containing protein [Flavihumibacter rivuli]ULQ56152.1 GAF domain-containing protein [Flavihumibacter rivuli]
MEPFLPKDPKIRTSLSFRPLVNAIEKKAVSGSKGASKLYARLFARIRRYPELLATIDNEDILAQQAEWVDMLMTTLFPVSVSDEKDLYAVGVPFSYKVVYASQLFREHFLDEAGNLKYKPEYNLPEHPVNFEHSIAYKLILSKFYNQKIDGNISTIHHFINEETGLINYVELELDPTFIDVIALTELPELGAQKIHCCNISELSKIDKLEEYLPLENFRFEGFTIVRLKDVTHREVLNKIKTTLLELNSIQDNTVFARLERDIQALIGISDAKMGITPFFRVNNQYVISEEFTKHSLLLHPVNGMATRQDLCKAFIDLFKTSDRPILFSEINESTIKEYQFLERILEQGYRSAAFFPLKDDGELLGVLSAVHHEPCKLQAQHLEPVTSSLPLFVLALEKSAEILANEVDKVVKRHFTAVQSSVEWKFTEAALHYLLNKRMGKKAKIEQIVFDQVYPLFGAIDIRNSSIERNNATQKDLLEQLEATGEIIRQAQQLSSLPILQEVAYRIEKYRYSASNILFTGDEVTIDAFLKEEMVELLEHLKLILPEMKDRIEQYFQQIDEKAKLMVHHRHHFEESITLVNQELSRFIDQEQETAQKIYPHYFERFVTDGIEFNMYIGQSITPGRPFDNFFLKNLKMWQLTTMANAAILVDQLQEKLPIPLQTTQLILAHSTPLSISFRNAERKFDVDGAYNIRYEIIKKRIDKVHLKNSNERLTQPGKIAIVYSQPKEASEYLDYIEFLQNKKLLKDDLEELELEELQGVVGLKALRVGINMVPAVSENEEGLPKVTASA